MSRKHRKSGKSRDSARFHELLRSWRQEADVTLKEVADAWGCSVAYVSDIERGNRKPPEHAWLEVFAELVERTEEIEDLVVSAFVARGNVVPIQSRDPGETRDLVRFARRFNDQDAEFRRKFKKLLDSTGGHQ